MIDFTNCPVNIDGNNILASNASISISNSVRALKQHGVQGASVQAPEGRVRGSISASYFITGSDQNIRNLTGINVFDVSIGPFNCYSGVLSSYSLNIEPYSVASCQVDIDFFGGYNQNGSTSNIEGATGFVHGGISNVETDLLWSNDLINVTYSMSQSVEPIYKLGDYIPFSYQRGNGSINVSLQGTGLGKIVTYPCDGHASGTINLTGLCSDFNDTIDFSGWVVNPSVSISEGSEVIGSLDVVNTF